jgi:hypothetical protein
VGGSPVVEVFPVAIGHFADPGLPGLDADAQVGRLVDLLAPFGGREHPVHESGPVQVTCLSGPRGVCR